VPGDLIFTGTPEGVGPVKAGDMMEGHIDGLEDLQTTVVAQGSCDMAAELKLTLHGYYRSSASFRVRSP